MTFKVGDKVVLLEKGYAQDEDDGGRIRTAKSGDTGVVTSVQWNRRQGDIIGVSFDHDGPVVFFDGADDPPVEEQIKKVHVSPIEDDDEPEEKREYVLMIDYAVYADVDEPDTLAKGAMELMLRQLREKDGLKVRVKDVKACTTTKVVLHEDDLS